VQFGERRTELHALQVEHQALGFFTANIENLTSAFVSSVTRV